MAIEILRNIVGRLIGLDANDNLLVNTGLMYGRNGVRAVTTTTYTLVNDDCGCRLVFTHASGCAVTVPNGLRSLFETTCEQAGAAQVSFTGAATINNLSSHTKTGGVGAVVCLLGRPDVANTYTLSGATGA